MNHPSQDKIRLAVSDTVKLVDNYYQFVADDTALIRSKIRGSGLLLQDEASLRIATSEIIIVRSTALLYIEAEYHTLRAYYSSSPGIIAFIIGVYEFIKVVIGVIDTLNTILSVLTSNTLAYWLDKLLPGFQDAWDNIMNEISKISAALGWGVDGVNHLLTGFGASADLWSMVSGKDRSTAQVEKIRQLQHLTMSYSQSLDHWEANPGAMISSYAEMWSKMNYEEGAGFINKLSAGVTSVTDKAEEALTHIGTITGSLLALQDGMPEFIADNIPAGVWDGITKVDTTINDRILPALTDITDRIDELDAVLDSYQAKAAALAERLAHPGDLLSEIDLLPDYVRHDQLVKIDGVTSALLKESNDAAFAAIQDDLTNFAMVAEALSEAPAPLPFLQLELPGSSPGITSDPRETWFVGDY